MYEVVCRCVAVCLCSIHVRIQSNHRRGGMGFAGGKLLSAAKLFPPRFPLPAPPLPPGGSGSPRPPPGGGGYAPGMGITPPPPPIIMGAPGCGG